MLIDLSEWIVITVVLWDDPYDHVIWYLYEISERVNECEVLLCRAIMMVSRYSFNFLLINSYTCPRVIEVRWLLCEISGVGGKGEGKFVEGTSYILNIRTSLSWLLEVMTGGRGCMA